MSIVPRETVKKEIGSNIVEIKAYATGREVAAIQQAYFKGSSVEIVGGQPTIKDFSPAVQFEVRAEMIRQLVVALNGESDNIADRCLDLPNEDYEQLIEYLDDIAAAKKKN